MTWLWMFLGALPWGTAAHAEEPWVPPMDALVSELVLNEPGEDIFQAWWMPAEFWRSAMAANPGTSQAMVDEMVRVVEPYTMVGVVQGDMGPLGGVTFVPPETLRPQARLKLADGTLLVPLKPSEIPPDVALIPQILRPMIAGMLGPMGEHFEILIFKNRDARGAKIIDPLANSSFSLVLGTHSLTWNLPLEGLLRPTTCKTCKRQLKGAWKFCPYDATPTTGSM